MTRCSQCKLQTWGKSNCAYCGERFECEVSNFYCPECDTVTFLNSRFSLSTSNNVPESQASTGAICDECGILKHEMVSIPFSKSRFVRKNTNKILVTRNDGLLLRSFGYLRRRCLSVDAIYWGEVLQVDIFNR